MELNEVNISESQLMTARLTDSGENSLHRRSQANDFNFSALICNASFNLLHIIEVN